MKKYIQSYIALLLFGLIFIPSIVLASWWNPISWFNNWGIFNKNSKQTQVLENRIKELEMGLGSTPSSTSTEINDVNKSEQKIELKLSNLNYYIDRLIVGHQATIEYCNEAIKSIDFYGNNYRKARELMVAMKDSEKVQYLKGFWELEINLIYDKAIEDNQKYRNAFLEIIETEKNNISELGKNKNENLSAKSVNKEVYLAYYNKLKLKEDAIEKNKITFKNIYNDFISSTEKWNDNFSYANTQAKETLDSYYKPLINGYKNNIQSNSATFYQPVLYPIIQMPKTTYCNMSGTGVNGSYTISCN